MFKIKQITKIKELIDKKLTIPTSDLTVQATVNNEEHLIQFEMEKAKKIVKTIKPGVWTFQKTNAGLELTDMPIRTLDLLESVVNTQTIKDEVSKFFNKIHVYERAGEVAKRSILLYSQPGLGKSSCITKLIKELTSDDPGTVVIVWDTSSYRSSDVSEFLSRGSEYIDECTRLFLIMEDIGGGNTEGYGSKQPAEAALLEMLDGVGQIFKLPTFNVATTNTPQMLLKSLADRPGRFDKMIELEPPDAQDRLKLAEFYASKIGRELSAADNKAIASKQADNLSIAHIKEVIFRAELDDKTISEVIAEMKAHSEKVSKEFIKAQEKKIGFY